MKKAVQQIMLGKVTKSERQAAETLAAIRAAGEATFSVGRLCDRGRQLRRGAGEV